MMKRRLLLILPAIVSLSLISVFFKTPSADAQADTANRERQVSPTPTPTPGAAVSPTPPTINDENEVIKVDTELVNLNVRVIDRNNRPINSIPLSDFKIYEDGVLQKIEFFSQSEVPTSYSMVIDNSGSIAPQFEKVIEAGKILVAANRPGDETSIIRFISSDKIEVIQDFTNNKADLDEILETKIYKEGGQTAIIDAVYLAVDRLSEQEKKGTITDRTRRAIVLVTDGEDRNSYYNEKQLYELLGESDVQIFVIGFVTELDRERQFISKSPQGKAKAFLERIATTSGGKVYFPDSAGDLTSIAKDISSELRMQYSIGYLPTNDRNDGTFRKIKVLIEDGPNKQKRIAITRAGRTAEGDGATPTIQRVKQPTNNR
jgi:Ca-activated chloride channel homolog